MIRCWLPRSLMVMLCAACPRTGEFDGGVADDAGPSDQGPSAADIGTACTYQEGGGTNPTNDCADELECVIVSGDGAYNPGFLLPIWQDQFTTYDNEAGTSSGSCSLVSSATAPVVCPAGTEELLLVDLSMCVHTCSQPQECGRGDYTCDVRYFSVGDVGAAPICTRKCGLDIPDCVRSGMMVGQDGSLVPALALQDLTGESQCDVDTGICAYVAQHGVAGPGAECTATEQCEPGMMCLQGPLLAALNPGANPNGPGFCALPCAPDDNDPSAPCQGSPAAGAGFVCQSAGSLNLGFDPLIMVDLGTGTLYQGGGFCFHQCELGVDGNCDAVDGTSCGSFDEPTLDAAWNQVAMCLPPAVGR
ncbi:MAG: hypothetical protein IT383_17495 [Deltaproteobacteria bacterium]|nr:hypothetical protein [Deltaproteobacteria bacterium]